MSDFGFAVAAVRLVVPRADRENEVPGVALALSHQEAAVLAFFRQQFLRLPARQVAVEPSGPAYKKRLKLCSRIKNLCFYVVISLETLHIKSLPVSFLLK